MVVSELGHLLWGKCGLNMIIISEGSVNIFVLPSCCPWLTRYNYLTFMVIFPISSEWSYPWYICNDCQAWTLWHLIYYLHGVVKSQISHKCVCPVWIFLPAALKGSWVLLYPERAGGRAAGHTSPVNTLTSIFFHGSFSNLARTFITLRSRTSSIMEVLPHQMCA